MDHRKVVDTTGSLKKSAPSIYDNKFQFYYDEDYLRQFHKSEYEEEVLKIFQALLESENEPNARLSLASFAGEVTKKYKVTHPGTQLTMIVTETTRSKPSVDEIIEYVRKERFDLYQERIKMFTEKNINMKRKNNSNQKSRRHLAGKSAYLWCKPNDPNIGTGWFEIKIGDYHSAETRDEEQRGMYYFRMIDERNGNDGEWSDYFSDDDETVMVDGVYGKALWD